MKKSREAILVDSKKFLGLIHRTELTDAEKTWMVDTTVQNFESYVNPGFLEYRKSVSDDYTAVEWSDSGTHFKDIYGKEYIDCLGGFGTHNVGHRHPEIVAAVKAQLDRQAIHSQEILDPFRALLAQLVADIMPGELQYSFMTNSGTEAVEGALKLSRLHTGRKNWVASVKAFHGKSMGALGATSKAQFRSPFLPLVPSFHHVPFGDIDTLSKMLKSLNYIGDEVAAVLLEPIQGEGGVNVPPDDYFPAVRQLCDDHGCLLILDEVQTGMGRTGKMFACEHWGIVPDIMCLGKAFGGGVMPAGAFVSTEVIWQKLIPNPFLHTSTFGGNPLACVAAIAAIHVTLTENLAEKAAITGDYFLAGLKRLQNLYPDVLTDVRGKGLMIGMEFPDDIVGYEVAKGLWARGVLVAGTLINAEVIRIEPPLTISMAEVDRVLESLDDSIQEVRGRSSRPSTDGAAKAAPAPSAG